MYLVHLLSSQCEQIFNVFVVNFCCDMNIGEN